MECKACSLHRDRGSHLEADQLEEIHRARHSSHSRLEGGIAHVDGPGQCTSQQQWQQKQQQTVVLTRWHFYIYSVAIRS
jgi:hypothetical protein